MESGEFWTPAITLAEVIAAHDAWRLWDDAAKRTAGDDALVNFAYCDRMARSRLRTYEGYRAGFLRQLDVV